MRNGMRFARRLRHQLRLAGAIHRDEEPGRFVYRAAYRQQAVILQNGCFMRAQGLCNPIAFAGVIHYTGIVGKQAVVLIECAGILRQRVQQAAQRRPSLPVKRVRMRRRDHVGPRHMNARVYGKGRLVDRAISFDHFTVFVDQHQVRHADVREVHPKRIDPKTIGPLRIARCNMSSDPFAEAELCK